jgi:hypothetical protein
VLIEFESRRRVPTVVIMHSLTIIIVDMQKLDSGALESHRRASMVVHLYMSLQLIGMCLMCVGVPHTGVHLHTGV